MLLTLKSVDKSIKAQKRGDRMKAGRQSSTASRRDMRTVVIEDIKGNTTITRGMGTNISHNMCEYPYWGQYSQTAQMQVDVLKEDCEGAGRAWLS